MQVDGCNAIQVLLVSDLPIVSWGLERLIESQQPRMTLAGTAASHEEALQRLGTTPVDVVLVDLDGHNVIAGITALSAVSQAKVIGLTLSNDDEFRDSAVLAGASGIVRKFESVTVLIKAIEKVSAGELWLDRSTTNRVFIEMARRKAEEKANPARQRIASLTRQERRVAAAIAQDASAIGRDLAERLHISESTLRNHLTSIYAKLDLGNRLELYAFATRHGIAAE